MKTGSVVAQDERRHLSASGLNDLLICERRYGYARGLDPEVPPRPPNRWLVLGQAVHSAIRAYYDDADPLKAIAEVIASNTAEEGDITLAEQHAQGCFESFRTAGVATFWSPTVQEQEFSIDIEGTKVVGFIDAHDDKIGVDWKTSTKPWTAKKLQDAWLQAAVYEAATGLTEWRFVVISYEDGYECKTHELTVHEIDRRRLRAMVRAWGPRVQSLDINDYTIVPTTMNWLCSDKWCDFAQVCPGGGKRGGN